MTMVKTFKGRRVNRQAPVRVYRNLHRGGFSVMQNGLVVGHADRLMMSDCRMVIHQAGVRRAQREGRKNVHAFIVGRVVSSAMGLAWDDPRPLPAPLRYVLGKGFRTEAAEVTGAMAVKLGPEGASLAYGDYRR